MRQGARASIKLYLTQFVQNIMLSHQKSWMCLECVQKIVKHIVISKKNIDCMCRDNWWNVAGKFQCAVKMSIRDWMYLESQKYPAFTSLRWSQEAMHCSQLYAKTVNSASYCAWCDSFGKSCHQNICIRLHPSKNYVLMWSSHRQT